MHTVYTGGSLKVVMNNCPKQHVEALWVRWRGLNLCDGSWGEKWPKVEGKTRLVQHLYTKKYNSCAMLMVKHQL